MVLTFIIEIIYIILTSKNYIKCSCTRDAPINKNGQCKSIFCTENEFKNNICSIDNEIIKTQWLNNFINFNEYRFRFTGMVINDEGELILESSPEDLNGQRLFFRLTKDGRSYYKDKDNEEIFSKSIVVLDEDNNGAKRYESQIFLIKIKNNNLDENKQFLVSISLFYTFMEIYDLDDNNITCNKIKSEDFGGFIVYSRRGSIIEFNNKEYVYAFMGQSTSDWRHYLVLQKFIFYDTNINKDNLNSTCLINNIKSINVVYSRVENAIKTGSNKILIFYITSEYYFKIEVLNDELNMQYEKYFEKVLNFYDEDSVFFKCINLKENIGVFAYYRDRYNNTLKLFIENIEANITKMFSFELNELNDYEYNNVPLLNDLIKINDKRFSLVSASYSRHELYIALFDLYNRNHL